MDKQQLINALDELGISRVRYNLNGELNPNSIIMYESYGSFEVFYLDERGRRNEYKVCNSESDACEYIYKLFREARETEIKYGLNTR